MINVSNDGNWVKGKSYFVSFIFRRVWVDGTCYPGQYGGNTGITETNIVQSLAFGWNDTVKFLWTQEEIDDILKNYTGEEIYDNVKKSIAPNDQDDYLKLITCTTHSQIGGEWKWYDWTDNDIVEFQFQVLNNATFNPNLKLFFLDYNRIVESTGQGQ